MTIAVGLLNASLMLAAGLKLGVQGLNLAPARRRAFLRGMLLNGILLPLAASLAVWLSDPPPAIALAVMAIAVFPAGTTSLLLANAHRADVGIATLHVVGFSLLTIPFGIALVMFFGADRGAWGGLQVAAILIGTQLVPLAAGVAIRRFAARLTDGLQRASGIAANVLFLGLCIGWAVEHGSLLGGFTMTGWSVIAGGVLLTVVSPWLISLGSPMSARHAISSATLIRNLSSGLLVTTLLGSHEATVFVLAYGAVMYLAAGATWLAAVAHRCTCQRPAPSRETGAHRPLDS